MLKGVLILSYEIRKEFGDDWENAGTRLFLGTAINNWNMETREHKAGRLVVHFRLNHQGNNQRLRDEPCEARHVIEDACEGQREHHQAVGLSSALCIHHSAEAHSLAWHSSGAQILAWGR